MVTGKYLQTHELWMTCGKLGLPTDRFGSICYAFPLKAFLGGEKGQATRPRTFCSIS